MSAKLSLLVKDESLFSKMHSFAWIVNIFKKSSVLVCIDGDEANAMLLKANKQPYEIELTPGYHQILIADPKAGKKKSYNAVSNFMMAAFSALPPAVPSVPPTSWAIPPLRTAWFSAT